MGDTDLVTKFSQILVKNGILDEIEKVDSVIPDMKGEQFMSICELVTVEFKDKKKADYHLFSKKMLPIPDPAQKVFFDDLMIRESTFLAKIVPELKRFYAEKTGKNDGPLNDLFPKIYYMDEERMIMPNLTKQGYEMLSKELMQDFEHAKLVLQSLARFQAVSHAFIMAEGGPEPFMKKYETIKREMKPGVDKLMTSMMEAPFACLMELLKTSSLEGSAETYAKLMAGNGGKWVDTMLDIMLAPQHESVLPSIIHGDLHNNNMLFTINIDPETKQKKVVFIDLQAVHVGLPGHDIGNFIFTSVKPEVRKEWRQLLRIYYDEFNSVIQEFGLSPKVTFEAFLTEYKSTCKYGYIIGLFMVVARTAMQNMDTRDGLFMNRLSEVLKNWMSENKDKADQIVIQIMDRVKDYEDMSA